MKDDMNKEEETNLKLLINRLLTECISALLSLSLCRGIICIGGNVIGPNHSGVYSMHSGTAAQRHCHWQRSEHMTS